MILLTLGMALAAAAVEPQHSCKLNLIASAPGENRVMFRGLSPDGRFMAIGWDRKAESKMERGAYLLDLRTGARSNLPHLNNAASFSPDGRFLVSANYAADRSLKTEIVELNRRTGGARTLASAPSAEWLGSYSTDGRWVVFNSTRSGGSDLYRVRRDTGSVEQLTSDARYEAHGQLFDRDRKLLFHRQTSGANYDIVMRDLATGKETDVGATPLEEAYPAISPDERRIAFSAVANAGEAPTLHLMNVNGSGRRRLTFGSSKDAYATWHPNGSSIYFVRFEPDASKIYRIDLKVGACGR